MIGLLGGTFDPVHNAHCRIGLEVAQQLDLDELRFIPCRQPPHRPMPVASAGQRLKMLQLAIAGQSGFVIDERELHRDGPSYMVDTLLAIRAEEKDTSLCLILGSDAFVELMGWNRWKQIIELAHIVIVYRPGVKLVLKGELQAMYTACVVTAAEELRVKPAGYIFLCPVAPLDIASTVIRAQILAHGSGRYVLAEDVWTFIQQQRLYLG